MPTAFALAVQLGRRCDTVVDVYADAQQAFAAGHLAPSTFHSVAELSALDLHSQLETFLEEVFMSCLMGESGVEVERIVAPTTRTSAMALIRRDSGRDSDYLTWLPITTTADRAARVFRAGAPFNRLMYRSAIRVGLVELVVVRNAVAHPSQVAGRKFTEMATAKGYPVNRPADFLLAQRAGATELEHQVALVRAIGRGLAEPSEHDVAAVLGPERPFKTGERAVPPGDYTCTACATVVHLRSGGDLAVCPCTAPAAGACPNCGQTTPCSVCSKPRLPTSSYTRTPRP